MLFHRVAQMCALWKSTRKKLRTCVIVFTNTRGSCRSKQKRSPSSRTSDTQQETYLAPSAREISVMLLFPNALCCSLYERNCACAATKIFTKFLPANNFCQLLRVLRKRSCTSVGNAQAQLHFRDDQQRAFGISNISNCITEIMWFFQKRTW